MNEQARKDAEDLQRMGPVSGPCRGRLSGDTTRLIRSGLLRTNHMDRIHFNLEWTDKGAQLVSALRGE